MHRHRAKNKNKENIRNQICRNNLKRYYKCGITIQDKCVLEVKRKLYREEICKRKKAFGEIYYFILMPNCHNILEEKYFFLI